MKRILLSFFSIATAAAFAQLPVSTSPENRNVVFEEFTGINCTYCPDGHRLANQMAAANPGDVFIINIHTGGYATPSGGDPDYRTPWGSAIANQSGLAGYPSGTINRQQFASQGWTSGTATAMSRGYWASAGGVVRAATSYANMAMQADLDVATRQLTIDVEVHYTSAGPALNRLNVALLQNEILGPQISGSTYNPTMVNEDGLYRHQHMLRDLVTGQWGDDITTTTAGTTVSRQYVYTVPADVNGVPVDLSQIELVAFITEANQHIETGTSGPINNIFQYTTNATLYGVNAPEEICGGKASPEITVINQGSDNITSFDVNYTVDGTPLTYSWTGSIAPLATENIQLPEFTFAGLSTTVDFEVVNVNGSTDQYATDNTFSGVQFNNNTDDETSGSSTLQLRQDAYGSETTWEFLDENGTVIASGGPYANLSAAGTQLHTYTIDYPITGCFEFKIYDSYGDGINGGYGAGNVMLRNGSNAIIWVFNGIFSSQYSKYHVVNSVGVEENLGFDYRVFPNPTSDATQIELSVAQQSDVSIEVRDARGAVVYASNEAQTPGTHAYRVDLSKYNDGIYMLNVTVNGKTATERISLIH